MSNDTAERADVDAFVEDPRNMADLPAETLYSLACADIDKIQLTTIRKRVAELAPRIPAVDALVKENRIARIDEINDLVPLLLPHTACKSYPLSLIDNGRFAQLNSWLNEFTTHDLSALDVSACQTLDDWLEVVERETPVRVLTSSGTSGKLSIIPRSVAENRLLPSYFRAFYYPFRGERGFRNPFAPHVYHVSPQLPGGRHSTALAARYTVEYAFDGSGENYVTPQGETSTDLLWMTGRMRKAQADGAMEKLKKTPAWKRLGARVSELQAQRAASLEQFYCDVLERLKGKTVVLRMGMTFLRDLVLAAEKHGMDIDFAPDSFVTAAGGLKGQVALTDADMAKIAKALPFPIHDLYSCSELYGGLARKCAKGHYHMPPWIVSFVLDPETGIPYPREGDQTGRFAGFDLWATTYWGGYVTGDEVTISWDGGCECGRLGPYLHGTIVRFSEKNGGDDKITCQRTAAAVDEMLEQLQRQ